MAVKMQNNYTLSSTNGTHYSTAISAGAAESEDFPGLAGDGAGMIRSLAIKSADNLDWQVELYDKNGYIIDKHSFVASEAQEKVESAVSYYYYTKNQVGWNIPLTIPNTTVQIGIRNKSGQAKTVTNTTTGAGTLILTLNVIK